MLSTSSVLFNVKSSRGTEGYSGIRKLNQGKQMWLGNMQVYVSDCFTIFLPLQVSGKVNFNLFGNLLSFLNIVSLSSPLLPCFSSIVIIPSISNAGARKSVEFFLGMM